MATHREEGWINLNGDVESVTSSLGLSSSRSFKRLDQIDRIRTYGLSNHVDLPQLVVCGDQSAGKSSVLEAITGIPFPRQDGMCTRFATEIIIRHQSDSSSITATIRAGTRRSSDAKQALDEFRRALSSLEELPEVISSAATLMGLKGYGSPDDASPFSNDVLRLEIMGNIGLHLTIVDLPGLISGADDDSDSSIVEDLAISYMQNPRTIILAVVQANNDIETEGIIRLAKKFDKVGNRTVGIVTKPDLINRGTESRVAALITDRQKLKLGFFLLKNPAPCELQAGVTSLERADAERRFFSSVPWSEQRLDRSRLGADNLRNFLQTLLDHHIERELPKVRSDIQRLLMTTREELRALGEERGDIAQMRSYLVEVSMKLYDICKAALDGGYDGPSAVFFGIEDDKTGNRLRANVHMENTAFATYMRDKASKRVIDNRHLGFAEDIDDVSDPEDDQLRVSKKEMQDWVKSIYLITRGRELPGSYNYALLSELYRQQSSRWATISKDHLAAIFELVTRFVNAALTYVLADDIVRRNVQEIVTQKLEQDYTSATDELDKLLMDEQNHPITYNHYYTDTIQKARRDQSDEQIKRSVERLAAANGKIHYSNTPGDVTLLVSGLQRTVETDMDKRGCDEALEALNSYYKVSRKTFVDNMCRQVIERHILCKLTHIFSPSSVSGLSDPEIQRIAMESTALRARRTELKDLRNCLERSLRELRE